MPNTFPDFIAGLEQLFQKMRTDENPLLKAANFLIDSLPEAPVSHADSGNENVWDNTFGDNRQRRWYWWAVRTGQLQNPYQRTTRLDNSFVTSPVTETSTGLDVTVFSDYPEAVFVIGDAGVIGEQAAVHEGRWWEFDREVEKLEDETLKMFAGYVFEDLEEAW